LALPSTLTLHNHWHHSSCSNFGSYWYFHSSWYLHYSRGHNNYQIPFIILNCKYPIVLSFRYILWAFPIFFVLKKVIYNIFSLPMEDHTICWEMDVYNVVFLQCCCFLLPIPYILMQLFDKLRVSTEGIRCHKFINKIICAVTKPLT
jgi:hypothetical protein